MTTTQDIFSIVKQINDTINYQSLQAEIQNLTRLRPTIQANHTVGLQQVIPVMDKILNLFNHVQTGMWTTEHENVVEQLGLKKFIGDNGRKYFEDIKNQLRSNTTTSTNVIQGFIQELNVPISKSAQLLTLLQPFNPESNIKVLDTEEGIIEIIFDGKVQIANVSDGKEQFNDWFLIIDGYAHLFEMKREDFQIINISKNSPTRIKIKTKIEIAAAILGIIASVYTIEQQYANDRIMVEQLRSRPLVDDSLQQQFLKEAEDRLNKNVEREINRIVDHKVEERKIDTKTRGDIVNSFQKGVQKQYNFIINGGEVKFYLGEGADNIKISELEASKQEIKLLKDKLENIKALNENNNTSQTPNSDTTTSIE